MLAQVWQRGLPGDARSSAEVQSISFSSKVASRPQPSSLGGRECCCWAIASTRNSSSSDSPLRNRTPFFPFSFTESFLLFTDSLRNISSASHGPRSSPAEFSSSNQHLLRERKSSAPSHSSQPTLFTFEPPVSNHVQPPLSTSAPQEYLYLHQCISRRAENAR